MTNCVQKCNFIISALVGFIVWTDAIFMCVSALKNWQLFCDARQSTYISSNRINPIVLW